MEGREEGREGRREGKGREEERGGKGGGKGREGRRKGEGREEGREGKKTQRRMIRERASSTITIIASVHLIIKVFNECGLKTRIRPVSLDVLNTAGQS